MKRTFIILAAISLALSCTENDKISPEEPEVTVYDFTLTVLDKQDELAKGASVQLFSKGQQKIAVQKKTATSKGKVVFKVPAGEYLAIADKHGVEGRKAIEVMADTCQNLGILFLGVEEDMQDAMARPHDFNIILKSYRNEILPSRKIELVKEGEMEPVGSAETDKEGKARFTNLKRGEYKLLVYNSMGEMMDERPTSIEVVLDDTMNTKEIKVNALLHDTDIIITGAMVDPRGSDCPANGATSKSGSFTLVHDKGGYEYIQLMALKDIDFSKTPYSVITGMCSGSDETYGSDGNGWVESIGKNSTTRHNKTTYQMNLTEGKVKAGEIFYVGGTSRMIASYYTGNGTGWFSAQIEEDRWWGFNFYYHRGDNDNGDAKGGSGLFNNFNSDKTTNVPDGIAVFNTINVDKNTVPIDCVFYGGASEPRTKDKFTICNNDLYSTIDRAGNEQKYFASGTNTWFMRQAHHDKGCFFMMGGHWYKGEWVEPRIGTPVAINVEKGADTVSAATIEKAEGVTQITL